MAGERITIQMKGGSPWGFRLFGGEEEPLIVAKLRKRSKAADAGLQEEDVILAINGHSCKDMSHPTAMGLVDSAGQTMTVIALRGSTNADALDTAFQSLGPLRQAPCQNTYKEQTMQSQSTASGVGGPSTDAVPRQHHILQDGDTTKRTTDSSFQQSGQTIVKKITTQRESHTISGVPQGAPSPPQQRFQVSSINTNGNSKPGVWVPGGVSETSDTSVTMTIGLGDDSKEDVAPPPTTMPAFNVNKVPKENQPGVWHPSSLSLKPMQQQQPQQQQQQQQSHQKLPWNQPQQLIEHHSPEPQPELEPPRQAEEDKIPVKWVPPKHITQTDPDPGSMSDSSYSGKPSDIEIKPMPLSKLIKEGSGSDEPTTPDSPSSWKKKRFYADSSFYNDPSGKYPTLEEQVKMARKVALSLTAPVNLDARGHKMFLKRKEKSQKWTSKKGQKEQEESEESEEEPYYNPDPWNQQGMPKPPSPADAWEPNTSAEDDLKLWRAPVIPKQEDKKNALSADEFERMRLYEEKNLHDNVSPQACFDLAQALKHANGKSGKMFQKRKQRMDKYTTDDQNVKHAPPTPIISQEKHYAELGPPTNRLKEMVEMPKPKMSPWEAALENNEGNVDAAFHHLREYEAKKIAAVTPKGRKTGPVPAKKPDMHVPVGPAVPPQGDNRAAKPWNAAADNAGASEPRIFSRQVSNGAGAAGTEEDSPKGWRPVSRKNGPMLSSSAAAPAGPQPTSGPQQSGIRLPFASQGHPADSSGPPEEGAPTGTPQGLDQPFSPTTAPKPKHFAPVRFNPQATQPNNGMGYPGGSATLPRSMGPREVQPPTFCDM